MRSTALPTAISAAMLATLAIAAGAPAFATENENPPEDQVRFFETSIRPLLANHCFKCHGPDKQKADLRLDSRQGVMRGGESGSAVVPGDPGQSLLIKAVGYADEELQMPPSGKLSDRELADLTRWVALGAPYPAAALGDGGRDDKNFWSLRPATNPPLPAVKDAAWPKTSIDYFVLARLEAENLKPAPPADKRTLLRRATFDLTGLPPTPAEVTEFLADDSPEAFSHVIERLLASPHYGERWGRHWLDVARYADSNGLDENVAYGNAWRYRDYVIAAFNADKPYDQFVLEQVAGDLLPTDELPEGRTNDSALKSAVRTERLIATGFLALGPKVLAEVDEQKMELDIVDEQVDTVGRSLMGMTLGCARCHDHKFDPIETEDYYALAGIFKSTRTMENFKKIARWYENPIDVPIDLVAKATHDRRVAEVKATIEKVIATANEALKAASTPPGTLPANPEAQYPEATRNELKQRRDELVQLEKSAPAPPTAMGASEGQVSDVPVLLRGNHLTPGNMAPRGFPAVLVGANPPTVSPGQSGRLELARWLLRPEHPLTSRVMVNRVWRWHFGQGIVRSADNFGHLGQRPSHPELLDHLAQKFVAERWSIKALHRLILLSSTWQMSSRFDEHAAEVDPQNQLYWRHGVRRLEAEEIRDSLLAASGLLDRSMGGSMLHVRNREFLFDHTSKDTTRYDSLRRAVYLPVIRNHLYDVFQLFDFGDGTTLSGDRATTTVATQALFMMNADLVQQACDRLAADALSRVETDEPSRIQWLYEKAYARPAIDAEIARGRELVASIDKQLAASEPDAAKRRQQAWACLAQVIVSANEFIHLR